MNHETNNGTDNERDEALLDVADAAIEEGNVDEAIAVLEAMDPSNPLRWLSLAQLFSAFGELDTAEEALERAGELMESSHPHLLLVRGQVALARWDFKDAHAALDGLTSDDMDPSSWADVLVMRAKLLELEHDLEGSDALWQEAARALPEEALLPPRLSPDAFRDAVSNAANQLPDEFQAALDVVAVVVDPVPTAELVGAPESGFGPELLGLYLGPELVDFQAGAGGELPPRIHLFQRNLESAVQDREHLIEEIQVTLYHELGHALGFDEDEVDEMGLG